MPHVTGRTMLICGVFFTGGSTALFGLLEYVPLPSPSDNSVDVTYLVLATILRVAQAIGTAAVLVSVMTLQTLSFPDSTTTILVSLLMISFIR